MLYYKTFVPCDTALYTHMFHKQWTCTTYNKALLSQHRFKPFQIAACADSLAVLCCIHMVMRTAKQHSMNALTPV